MATDDIWAAIEGAGPRGRFETFDPVLIDDVLQAERSSVQYDRRRAFVASYSWAVPTREAVERISVALAGRAVLEVCAGNGLWAKLLSEAGVCVTATDGVSPGAGASLPIEVVEAEAAVRRDCQCRALLLCWPPFKDDCAFRALRAFEGDRVVYIGDVRFTAEAQFHALLASSWEVLDEVALPSWPGTSDCVYIYGKRP